MSEATVANYLTRRARMNPVAESVPPEKIANPTAFTVVVDAKLYRLIGPATLTAPIPLPTDTPASALVAGKAAVVPVDEPVIRAVAVVPAAATKLVTA